MSSLEIHSVARRINGLPLTSTVTQLTSAEEREFILSRGFADGLEKAELSWNDRKKQLRLLKRSEKLAHLALGEIQAQLDQKQPGTKVVIGYSGGRDSTALAILTRLASPNTPVILATILTGYVYGVSNPRQQARVIDNLLKNYGLEPMLERNHLYVDATQFYKEHVVSQKIVDEDHHLGTAAFCSLCKLVMESRLLPQLAIEVGAGFIFNGNNRSQGKQRFAEQTISQQRLTSKWLTRHRSEIAQASPLYDLVHFHFDAELILAYFGIPFAEQQLEMSCALGKRPIHNLSPSDIRTFVTSRLRSIPEEVPMQTIADITEAVGQTSLVNAAKNLLMQMEKKLK